MLAATTATPVGGTKRYFLELIERDGAFLVMLLLGFLVSGLTYQTPHVAMWVTFLFAGYAAISNDSIQTLGTFIASNKNTQWWKLWLFIAAVFLATVTWSWVNYGGDVSFERLQAKGFETAPTKFHYLQVAAPLFLLILTRLKMPVSTTFLLLSCYAASGKSIAAVTLKSVSGYGIAFGTAIVIFFALGPLMKRMFKGDAHPAWRLAQWVTTGTLWSVWLQQDAANIAVSLPRAMSGWEFIAFAGIIVVGLGFMFKKGGERIQEVVEEKSDVVDVRSATVIDLIYATILYVFKIQSKVPMSTTWVFVGLLAGREMAMAIRKSNSNGRGIRGAMQLMAKDLFYVTVGFIVSLILAAAINPSVRLAMFGF